MIHGVNVHSMDKDHRVVRSIVYDRIIFNFPHAGFHFGRETDSYTILYVNIVSLVYILICWCSIFGLLNKFMRT